jgi:hypothetical protein
MLIDLLLFSVLADAPSERGRGKARCNHPRRIGAIIPVPTCQSADTGTSVGAGASAR